MTNDQLFGIGYHPSRAMRAIDERDEDETICGRCGQNCDDTFCEACRDANEAEMRASLHLHNTLAFIEKSLGLR